MDLRLNPATRDLDLTPANGYLVVGKEAIAQALRIRLLTFKGEWFLDRRVGVPYRQVIFAGKVKQTLVDTVFREAIKLSPGIASLGTFASVFDKRARNYSLRFTAFTTEGERIDFDEPFILDIESV